MKIVQFQDTHHQDVLRIRDDTFAGLNLNRFTWQPCQQVESLDLDCFKYVYNDGAVRGYGAAYPLDDTHFRLNLIVEPDRRNQRIGTLLLSNIEAATRKLGGKYLQARILDSHEPSLGFAFRRGFTEIHRMRGMSLSKRDFHFQRGEELKKKLSAEGFMITTLREELAANNNPIQKLAALHKSAQQGWPSPDPTWEHNSSMENLESLFANLRFPECFTILKLKEEYVGYTSAKNKTTATAVHPDYRSIGIATYMKAVDLKRCIDEGKEYFESASANPAMHKVNERLGYRFNGLCEVRFVKYLE